MFFFSIGFGNINNGNHLIAGAATSRRGGQDEGG
jgi:hypothetical protein